jgi:hypothetical protein
MGGFTSMMATRTVSIITFRGTSEDITKSAAAKITNITIAIIITGGASSLNTPRHPTEMGIGGSET